jgi:hypothetical protein
VDMEAVSCGGDTPLICAARSGNIFLVGECLNRNMNPFARNILGMNAQDQAAYFSESAYSLVLNKVIDAAIR